MMDRFNGMFARSIRDSNKTNVFSITRPNKKDYPLLHSSTLDDLDFLIVRHRLSTSYPLSTKPKKNKVPHVDVRNQLNSRSSIRHRGFHGLFERRPLGHPQ